MSKLYNHEIMPPRIRSATTRDFYNAAYRILRIRFYANWLDEFSPSNRYSHMLRHFSYLLGVSWFDKAWRQGDEHIYMSAWINAEKSFYLCKRDKNISRYHDRLFTSILSDDIY